MSPVASPSVTDHLEAIARLLHDALPTDAPPHAVFVAPDGPDGFGLGLHPLLPVGPHPLDALVGFRAPDAWEAFGVAGTGRAHVLEAGAAPPSATRIAYLLTRCGTQVAVIDGSGGSPFVLAEPAQGIVPDVLARVLGLPCAAADHDPAWWVEAVWLERIASVVLPEPARRPSWRWLADRHPLAEGRRAVEPEALAARSAAYGAQRWAGWRATFGHEPLPAERGGLAAQAGSTLRLGRWFDDGSLERWLLRDLPPPLEVLADLLEVLPGSVGDQLCEALARVGRAQR
jgi:hypothetical protein